MTAKFFAGLFGAAVLLGVTSINTTIAKAEPTGAGKETKIERICSTAGTDDVSDREQRRIDRVAARLKLTDAQKAAFKDLADARIKARNDSKTALCANKQDLTKIEGRLAFRQAVLENRLAGMKATTPKLLAFYNSLDADQKSQFDELKNHRRKHRHHKNWRHRQHHHHQ